jgi:hypothetical protein
VAQVAQLESERLFLVKTESGIVYTGTISTTGTSDNPPIKIEIAEMAGKEAEIPQRKIIKLSQSQGHILRQSCCGANKARAIKSALYIFRETIRVVWRIASRIEENECNSKINGNSSHLSAKYALGKEDVECNSGQFHTHIFGTNRSKAGNFS